MKNLNKIFVAVLLVLGLNSYAQDSNNPWAISFGANAVDTRTSAGKDNFTAHFDQMFKVKQNWNILPSVSYLNVTRYVGSGFSVGVTGSVNKITKLSVQNAINPLDFDTVNPGDLTYYSADADIKYSFMELIKSKVIDPSLHVGGGYTWLGDEETGTANVGIGLAFWFTETVGLSLQTTYKHSFVDDTRLDFPSHFQHFAGLTFKFGGKDTDNDGIYDKDDACPDVAGPKELKGCPDTDGDGVLDKDDKCIDVKGTVANNGCPEISEEQVNKLNAYAKTILFNSGKATFKQETFAVLQSITAILKEYPSSKFSIEGHTDNTGAASKKPKMTKAERNQKLSEERAAAVKNYLIENGIATERLTSVGFGETKPIDSNKTAAGKANNRRVEVKLVK